MEPARRGGVRTIFAVVLLLAGLASLGVWKIAAGNENLPYDAGATPPASVHVTKDRQYSLAVPGGVRAMLARGVPTKGVSGQTQISLECTWSSRATTGTSGTALIVSSESTSTKAENTVGHFAAPVTGDIQVLCAGWGAMFVPDSDDRPTDWAGVALLLAIVTLTVGAALGLTELRLAVQRARSADGDDDVDDTEQIGAVEDEEDADVR
jgi:hypothetical protein